MPTDDTSKQQAGKPHIEKMTARLERDGSQRFIAEGARGGQKAYRLAEGVRYQGTATRGQIMIEADDWNDLAPLLVETSMTPLEELEARHARERQDLLDAQAAEAASTPEPAPERERGPVGNRGRGPVR